MAWRSRWLTITRHPILTGGICAIIPTPNIIGANPSRTLRDAPVILVGDANYGKIEPVVANLYDRFDYIRLWWPNQDYYDLTWERIRKALTDPAMRDALFQIWLNRDYTKYGQVTWAGI